jgi:uncharacterized membrane protein YheB (UPF0754 family)
LMLNLERTIYLHSQKKMVAVAQLVRASDCGSEGRGFEPHQLPGFLKSKRLSETTAFFLLIMNYWLLLLPVISAFIGWFTNWIAIKMLFHPREPKKILGFTFQGIFPKRQQVFAQKLGSLVSRELLSFSDIEKLISHPDNFKKISPQVESHIDQFLRVKLATEMPMISTFIGEKTLEKLKAVFLEELNNLFPTIMQQYAKNLESDLDLEKIVVDKVAGFSSDKLEDILQQIMSKEFRFVELIGAVLGFLIGLLQVGLTLLTH